MATIIIKPTTRCNSNCVYCEVTKLSAAKTMDDALLATVFRRIDEYLAADASRTVNLTWHGGEVTLLGARFFNAVHDCQEAFCGSTKRRIKHSIQTNCTAMTQELVDALKSLGIAEAGTSYDPLRSIRGSGSEPHTDEYIRGFLKGTELLDRNGISWSVIYVVHRGSLRDPIGLYHHITNLNVKTSPKFNQVYLYRGDPHSLAITGREYAGFLGTLFTYFYERRLRYRRLSPASDLMDRVTDPAVALSCAHSGACAHSWLYIGPDGTTSQCGRSGDAGVFEYQNIDDAPIDRILSHAQRGVFTERLDRLLDGECADCRFWGLCHGGCPTDAYLTNGDVHTRSTACEWTRIFLTEYLEPLMGRRIEMRHRAREAVS